MWVNVGDKHAYGERHPIPQDFKDINNNLAGAYALSNSLTFDFCSTWCHNYESRHKRFKINDFEGIFNYNGFNLSFIGFYSYYGCSTEEYIFGKDYERNRVISKSIPYEEPVLLTPFWQGIPERIKATDKEYYRLKKAHERFFIKEPSTRRTKILLQQFTEDYNSSKPSMLNIEGLPGRTRILLLRKITDLKLKKLAENGQTSSWWRTKTITKSNSSVWVDDYDAITITYKQTTDLVPTSYIFGGLTHTLTNQCFCNKKKPGYAYYNQLGDYDKVGSLYSDICGRINSKKIAELSRMSRVSGNAIILDQLFNAGYNDTFELAITDADNLNKINFLLDHEVASRLVRTELPTTQYDVLPIGVSIARMQYLVLDTESTWGDLSKTLPKKSDYHCFTNEVFSRESAIKIVNDDFNLLLQNKRKKYLPSSSIAIWTDEHHCVDIYDDNPRSLVIATQEGIHQELLSEYGGGYESSGDPYDSST